jgi:hypothetical protein
MRMLTAMTATGVLGLVLATSPVSAADSCGGGCPKLPKSTRWVSATATPLGSFFGTPNVLTAGLLKGATKSVLEVEGMLTDGPITALQLSRVFALGVSVNGLPMQPAAAPGLFEAISDCGGYTDSPTGDTVNTRACTVTGQWWLDMDDPANVALLGVPITVTLVGGDLTGGPEVGAPVDMSLRVRQVKKK